MWTDNPIFDYDSYLADEERKREIYPICSNCGDYIDAGYYYRINGKVYCEECMNDLFQYPVEVEEV